MVPAEHIHAALPLPPRRLGMPSVAVAQSSNGPHRRPTRAQDRGRRIGVRMASWLTSRSSPATAERRWGASQPLSQKRAEYMAPRGMEDYASLLNELPKGTIVPLP